MTESDAVGSPADLNAVIVELIALERARRFRRRLVKRYAVLAIGAAIVGLSLQWYWFSASALLFLLPPTAVWLVERDREQALARRAFRARGVRVHVKKS